MELRRLILKNYVYFLCVGGGANYICRYEFIHCQSASFSFAANPIRGIIGYIASYLQVKTAI